MYLVSGKNVSSNPMENVSEEIKKFLLKHHRGYGKEEMMKRLPDVDDVMASNSSSAAAARKSQVAVAITLTVCE